LGQLCFIWFVNEISWIFGHMLVLFYADDMKLFLPVHGFRDCLTIQNDLNRLAEWCDANALELNVGKCKLITFSRLRHPIEYSYMLCGIILDRVFYYLIILGKFYFQGRSKCTASQRR
jgi:hypothetical protein